ncbi:MAG: antitoxin Xre-like helix-turn-helix domain-containing protein [Terriglobales bacterium]|jgi:putative toxin-antitoxin system antitoxin component (TIGR02293 family)
MMGDVGLNRAAGRSRPGSSRRSQRFRLRGSTLGLTAATPGDLVQQLERGFSFKTLQTLESRSGLAMSRLAEIIGIPERTLARRKVSRKLTPEESERLLRISAVFEDAVDLFEGDVSAAVKWLTTPRKALGDRTALAYARTEPGGREVENLIGRLEHGIFT